MLYDMERNKLQQGFQLDHIYRWFEVSQVGFGSEIYIHTDTRGRLKDAIMNKRVRIIIMN